MENIRELKNALDSRKSENIANFSSALITAFEILYKVSRIAFDSYRYKHYLHIC